VRVPTPEPVRVPTPEPVRVPTPEPVRVPTPEPAPVAPTWYDLDLQPVRVPTPEPAPAPVAPTWYDLDLQPVRVPTPEPAPALASGLWHESEPEEVVGGFEAVIPPGEEEWSLPLGDEDLDLPLGGDDGDADSDRVINGMNGLLAGSEGSLLFAAAPEPVPVDSGYLPTMNNEDSGLEPPSLFAGEDAEDMLLRETEAHVVAAPADPDDEWDLPL
jgi:hypothetical protein